jgi:hypothetical protein
VIVAGVDEAGYGPRLGPLVVAASAFRTALPVAPGAWPEVRFLCAPGPLNVCDSKLAFSRANGLANLERVVMAFAAKSGAAPVTLADYLGRWAVEGAPETLSRRWYGWKEWALPQEIEAGDVHALAEKATAALAAVGFEYIHTEFAVVDEGRFNDILLRTGNKATLLFGRNSILLRRLWDEYGRDGVYVTADRHGGRKFYAGLLDIAFPEAEINILYEEELDSGYRLSDSEGREMFLRFTVHAEEIDSATALSSMWAKYTREVLMRVFNDYWLSRSDGLVRTAGYWVDAERFISDLLQAGVVTPPEVNEFTRWK